MKDNIGFGSFLQQKFKEGSKIGQKFYSIEMKPFYNQKYEKLGD
jgi:hypothetical protein